MKILRSIVDVSLRDHKTNSNIPKDYAKISNIVRWIRDRRQQCKEQVERMNEKKNFSNTNLIIEGLITEDMEALMDIRISEKLTELKIRSKIVNIRGRK